MPIDYAGQITEERLIEAGYSDENNTGFFEKGPICVNLNLKSIRWQIEMGLGWVNLSSGTMLDLLQIEDSIEMPKDA